VQVGHPIDRTAPFDAALVQACRRGDRQALERVLRAEAPYLERLIGRLIGPSADLEDLLQQTLIAAVQAFPRYRGEAAVRTWMARIAVNIVRQHLRRPQRRRTVALELVADEPQGHAPSPEATADRRQQIARLFHHLDAIGARKRLAFALHVLEGHPIDEVAALMGASVAATKSRVFWARRALLGRARKDPVLRELLAAEDQP
jgi:RNA polymerase sigma-70 factor (ECF subfamily)